MGGSRELLVTTGARPGTTAWRFVLTFGVVSMFADIAYEGARSITGPLLASFGATALVVGLITGLGDAAALVLRLLTGTLADRTRRFWSWTIAGYALSVLSVPFLGVAGALWVACALVLTERIGKAVRSPAKDALLAAATSVTGRGKGFAVHEALDQLGALTGPLVVAAMLAATGGRYSISLAVLGIPAVLTMATVIWLRWRVPDPTAYEGAAPRASAPAASSGALSPEFWLYAAFTAATTIGFATFGVLSFHMVDQGILAVAVVPVVYAVAMAADAVSALIVGWWFDSVGPRVLFVLPILSAIVPLLAFTTSPLLVVAGAVVWGAALGVQESTLRAVVADLVPSGRRATAYGIYASVVGGATAVGGAATGLLYEWSTSLLVVVVVVVQAVSLAVFGFLLARRGRTQR